MKKDTHSLASAGSGREFVYQKLDEADKNHKENATPDDTIGEGRMYSTGTSTCPVASFRKYIAKLHPDLCGRDLWRTFASVAPGIVNHQLEKIPFVI